MVSVCVITYNSGKTVLETLESVSAQSYPDIELIVSDDCSSDDTVDLCRKWLEDNSTRFFSARIITGEKNEGVAGNLNRAVSAASGEWIKTLAGDDVLMPDCIQDNLLYAQEHDNQGIVFSKYLPFRIVEGKREPVSESKPEPSAIAIYGKSAREQYLWILSGNTPPAITAFIRRDLLIQYPFPSQYPFCEDYPQWLYLTKAGIKLNFLNETTVLYRLGESLSRTASGTFVNEKLHYSKKAVFFTDVYWDLSKLDPENALRQKKEFFLGEVAVVLLKNRKTFFSRIILFLFKMATRTRKIQ